MYPSTPLVIKDILRRDRNLRRAAISICRLRSCCTPISSPISRSFLRSLYRRQITSCSRSLRVEIAYCIPASTSVVSSVGDSCSHVPLTARSRLRGYGSFKMLLFSVVFSLAIEQYRTSVSVRPLDLDIGDTQQYPLICGKYFYLAVFVQTKHTPQFFREITLPSESTFLTIPMFVIFSLLLYSAIRSSVLLLVYIILARNENTVETWR